MSYLGVGESYVASADIRIPRGLVGTYNVLIYTDNRTAFFRGDLVFNVREDNEANNRKVKPITISAPPLPDLQVASVAASPDEVFADGQLFLNWRVENKGTGSTPPDQAAWSDGIYLSKDTTFNPATDRLIGSRPRSGGLVKDDGYSVSSFGVNVPRDVEGDWYVFVAADYQNNVYEFSNEGNNSNYDRRRPVKIKVIPLDLIVESFAAPTTGTAARQLTVNWKIKNRGIFDGSASWFDTVYISNEDKFDPAKATPLATIAQNVRLQAGSVHDGSAQVTLPACNAGRFYLFVLTDSRNSLFEFDPDGKAETNNFSEPKTIQINAVPPDLQVAEVKGFPATGSAGQPVSVTWTVRNSGKATIEGAWTDSVYLSESATFNAGSALLLGSFRREGNLDENASYTRTENVVVPARAQGLYSVFVFTDSGDVVEECANDNNNVLAGSVKINIDNRLPDFKITAINAPDSIFSGQTINLTWTGQNAGNANAQNTAWNDKVYLSSNQTFDGSARLLATKLINGPLNAGASYNGQTQVTIPVVPAGSYFLIVVSDGDDSVFEGKAENNNSNSRPIQVQAPDVDLRVTAVDASDQAYSGLNLTVSWAVNNAGAAQTFATQWTDRVFLSRDLILDSTDRQVGYLVHDGALNGRASYSATLNVEIPAGLSGPYYVFVQTDVHNAVAENNEDNNAAHDTPTNLQLTPPVDLTVTTVPSLTAGTPGENATITWTVRNQSNREALGRWTDAVYLSLDQTWDINDAEVGRLDHNGPLAAGQTYEDRLTAKLPPVTPGNYYLIVRTDVRNRVREENESNNTTASTGTMTVDVPTLTLGVPTSSTIQTGQERFYKVNVPSNETLRFTLDGQNPLTSNELFARFGLLPSRSAFDFSFSRPYEPDQEIVVPDTHEGTYYSLARSAFIPNETDPFSIKAEIVPFSLTSVSPSQVGDNGQVTITIKGAKFREGATVRLLNSGTALTAGKVWLVDSTTAKVRFFFSDAPQGVYDVTLTNPDGVTVAQRQALVIETATPIQAATTVNGDFNPRVGRRATFSATLTNLANVDIPYTYVIGRLSRQVQMGWTRPTNSLPRQADQPQLDWKFDSPIASFDGKNTTDSFCIRDLEPRQQVSFDLNVGGMSAGQFKIRIIPFTYSKEEYIAQEQASYESLRLSYLSNPQKVMPSDLQPLVNNASRWWQYFEQILIANGYLDILPTPNFDLRDGDFGKARNYPTVNRSTTAVCPANQGECIDIRDTFHRNCLADAGSIYEKAKCGFQAEKIFFDCLDGKCCEDIRCERQGSGGGGGNGLLGSGFADNQNITSILSSLMAASAPQCQKGSSRCGDVRPPSDPNEKEGPIGFGPSAFVGLQDNLPYSVNFENVPTAGAHAQRVHVIDSLVSRLDWRTFRLKEVGFGSYRVQVPENRAFYQGRIQLGEDLGNLLADISAGIDIATGQVTWTLTAIDPNTGEQPNSASLGLLPPNDQTGRGQGYVMYTVQPKAGLPTGTVISNKATIIFDTEEPITTNTVTNTLDADAPSSRVTPLPSISQPAFTLSWSGEDPAGGSGLQSFDIWVSEGGGAYQPFLSGTTETSAQFNGQPGKSYNFYSIARDNAGNVEAAPPIYDTGTTVLVPLPTLTGLSPNSAQACGAAFTLTVNGTNFVSNSTVNWNGAARPTTFVSATQLTAAIPASDLAAAGTANITVTNPEPGGGRSAALSFTVLPSNPVPAITAINPNSATAGGAAFTLTLTGTNFINGSKVLWSGKELATTFVSGAQLTAQVTAAEIATAGAAQVTVFNPAPCGGTSNAVSFTISPPPTAFEADVAPRPNGNGTITIADWVQVGRFATGLETPAEGSEFQRADCAPRATLGDGKLTISDWVQAGLYASGLDPLTAAGGPTRPMAALAADAANLTTEPAARSLRIGNATFARGQMGTLIIEMDAQGNENAVSFTLNFDPALLGFVEAVLSQELGEATLLVNNSRAANGQIGIALALPVGKAMAAGTNHLLTLRFLPVGGTKDALTKIGFGDQVVKTEIVDAAANALPGAALTEGSVLVTGSALTNVSAADYSGPVLAVESIAAAFGAELAAVTEQASSLPLPTMLAGTTVKLTDTKGVERLAPLFFVSPTQINYLIPVGTAEGIATVTIFSETGAVSSGLIQVTATRPSLFSTDASGQGVVAGFAVRVRPDGSQSLEPLVVFNQFSGQSVALPIDLGSETDQVYLVLFGTGIRHRPSLADVKVTIGDMPCPIEYAGAQGSFTGLDQVNVRLPRALAGRGKVEIHLTADQYRANSVWVHLK